MGLNALGKTFAVLVILFTLMVSVASAASVEENRDSIRKMSSQTLDRLYSINPAVRDAVEKAVGYAVFDVVDADFVLAGGGSGKGLAVNNSTKAETFMGTGDVQVGLGLGIKEFDVVFVFKTQKAFTDFVNNGWEVGAQASAAATDNGYGRAYQGARLASPDVLMYQLTEKGLEASATIMGIKYFKDRDLN